MPRAAALALLALGCIPDRGVPLDAPADVPPVAGVDAAVPLDKPLAPDAPADQPPGPDATEANPTETPLTGCGVPNYELSVSTSGTVYLPDAADVPAGKCIRLCVTNPGGERHTNDSDESLFPPFDTGGGETTCAILEAVLPARATPYRIFCRQHFGMVILVTVK